MIIRFQVRRRIPKISPRSAARGLACFLIGLTLLAGQAMGSGFPFSPLPGSGSDHLSAQQAGLERLAILPASAASLVEAGNRVLPLAQPAGRTQAQLPARVAAQAHQVAVCRWQANMQPGDVLQSSEFPEPNQRSQRGPPDPIS